MQENFSNLLKKNGLKVTAQRTAILEVLSSRPDEHFTAEEIYDNVRKQFPEIGLATVYRTIQMLSDLGLIDKLNLNDGFTRYEIGKENQNEQSHHHHHLICIACGHVFAFQDDLLENLEYKILKTMDFEVINHEVKLFGYCTTCNQSRNKE